MYDLVIRGATVIDGLGHDPQRIDVAVKDGRIAALGALREDAAQTKDADGLTLAPGIVDLHTHFDAQITWDATLSPSPSLGVTSVVMGNCGFGIAPAPPAVRDLIMKNLSVVEGMDLDALRAGIAWEFDSFADYMAMLRRRGAYANVAVLTGHSVIRTAVMGEEASTRKTPTKDELARMTALVTDAMQHGAIGLGSSYSPNHSGYGGVPMPSTISDFSELEALVAAMGPPGRGILQIASGTTPVDRLEPLAERYGRTVFKSAAMAMYSEREPQRAIGIFEQCKAAQARGHGVYVQIPCQPLSFDFTLANAYPFYSHPAFARIKAYGPEQLKQVFRDATWRDEFRSNLRHPAPAVIFQGNWDRIVVAATAQARNAAAMNRTIAELAASSGRDPLDAMLDLALDEDLQTTFLGQFQNVGAGVADLLKHEAGVIALSDAGAHLIYMCEAGFGLHFLAHWVRETGTFDLVEGVRRLTSHPADLYGLIDRGRIAVGGFADMMLFDPARVGITPAERLADLPGGGRRTVRRPIGVHGVYVNGIPVFDGRDYVRLQRGPGHILDRFAPSRRQVAAQAAD